MVKATHGKTVTISQKAEIFDLRVIVQLLKHVMIVDYVFLLFCFKKVPTPASAMIYLSLN